MTNTTIKVVDSNNREKLYTIGGGISDKCLMQEIGFMVLLDGKKNLFRLDLGTQVLYTHLSKQNDYLVLHKDNINETEKIYGGEYTPSSKLPPLGTDPNGDNLLCDCKYGHGPLGSNICVHGGGCVDNGCSNTMLGAMCQQKNDGVNNPCYCITPAPM